jgi:hypothetical protein
MSKNKLIPSVHNYCDRWCERCVFVERCAIGLEEIKRWNRSTPMTEEEMWGAIGENFKESLKMLDDMLRQAGIDPEDMGGMPDLDPETAPSKLDKLDQEIFEKGMVYYKLTEGFFQNNAHFFEQKGIELQHMAEMNIPIDLDKLGFVQDAVEILRQYAPFIGVKARRAVSGLDEMHHPGIWGPDPEQSDANGSAKVCILCIDQSIASWETLRKTWPEKTDEILDPLLALSQFRKELVAHFPDWKKFVRPGFDTEPAQIRRFELN